MAQKKHGFIGKFKAKERFDVFFYTSEKDWQEVIDFVGEHSISCGFLTIKELFPCKDNHYSFHLFSHSRVRPATYMVTPQHYIVKAPDGSFKVLSEDDFTKLYESA